jgi:hypothetical protein
LEQEESLQTPDFEDVDDEDSISPPPSIDSSPSTPSSPPATDPDPPNLLTPVMPDNSDQPFVPDDNPSSQEQPPPTPILLPDRLKRVRRPNPKYVNSVSIEGLKKSPHLVREAICEELKQLVDIGAFIPILKEQATNRIIPSKMIIKNHKSERNEETLSSSPTVSKFTILTLCATAANQKKEVATADVKGAYLEAFLKTDVFRIPKYLLYSWNFTQIISHSSTMERSL